MKKIATLFVILMSTFLLTSPVLAESAKVDTTSQEMYEELEDRRGNASETTINNITQKEDELQTYIEKCGGNKTNGTVLYWLKQVQKYSVPVCFIGLVIASLNFFIIGNKKLDKKEQGFSMLIAFGLGLIVFQILPLLFAIIVAGR